jgi:hypothetical protein
MHDRTNLQEYECRTWTSMSTIETKTQRGKYEPVAKSSGGAEAKCGRQVKHEPLSHFTSDTEHCERCTRVVLCEMRVDQTTVNFTEIVIYSARHSVAPLVS